MSTAQEPMAGHVHPPGQLRSTGENRVDPGAEGHAGVAGNTGDSAALLAERLLPTLLHSVNNHTQFLTGLRAVLALAGGGRILYDRADDLAETAREVEDAGWLLALVASGSGANLMLARREARGLQIVAHFVDEALRRDGGARLARATERAWPALAPAALDGWQLPWAIGSLLMAAGLDSIQPEGSGGAKEATFDGELVPAPGGAGGAALTLPRGPRVESLAPVVDALLSTATSALTDTHYQLNLPAGWLVFADGVR